MFGNNFNKSPEKRVAPVAALEREPSKEEIIAGKLDKLNLSKADLDSAIENAGGKEKVTTYLKEHGNDDYFNHKDNKWATVIGGGTAAAWIAGVASLPFMTDTEHGVAISAAGAALTGVTALIGSALVALKVRQQEKKAQTVDVLMDVTGVYKMTGSEHSKAVKEKNMRENQQ